MRLIPEVGDNLLGRYTLEELLSSNESTAVFRAHDTRLDVKDAVKILLSDDSDQDDAERKSAFLAGSRNLARLSHPNIVHVTNIESKQGLMFCVMEWLLGLTLNQHICDVSESLNTKEIIEIFISVIEAVMSAHANGVVHRRINPTNIFLNQLGTRLAPIVLNFGMPKQSQNIDPATELPYLAPEQLTDFEAGDEKSDIFSICATIYFAFVHRPPIKFDSIEDYRAFYQRGEEIDFPDEIPDSFVPLLLRGMSFLPEDRFDNVGELLKYIKKIGGNFKLSANLTVEAPKSYVSGQFAPISPSKTTQTGSSKVHNDPAVVQSNPVKVQTGPIKVQTAPVKVPSVPSMKPISATTPSQPILVSATNSTPSPDKTPSSGIGQAASQTNPNIIQKISVSAMEPVPQKRRTNASSPLVINPELPEELQSKLKIIAPVYLHADQYVLRVQNLEDDTETFILKMLHNPTEKRRNCFVQAMQNVDSLSRVSNCVQSFVEQYPELPGYLTEDYERQSLAQVMATTGPLPPAYALDLAIMLAQGMNDMHGAGIINGNIKPSNVFIEVHDGANCPVFYDISQRLYAERPQEFSFEQLPFIAPELDYNYAKSNAQTDIYAFGMLVCFMLLGRSPYSSTTPSMLYQEILAMSRSLCFQTLAPHIEHDFAQIIDWCIAFDPNARYRSFADIMRDLYIVRNKMQASAIDQNAVHLP